MGIQGGLKTLRESKALGFWKIRSTEIPKVSGAYPVYLDLYGACYARIVRYGMAPEPDLAKFVQELKRSYDPTKMVVIVDGLPTMAKRGT